MKNQIMKKIPAGYKQTEMGVIPEDWEVVSMGTLGSFSKGQGIRKDQALSGKIPCIRYGEIYTHHNNIIKQFNSWIAPNIAKTSKKLKQGDILFAGSGETKEEIGKCVAFLGAQDAYVGGDIVILSPTKGDSCFFGYLFNSPIIVSQKSSKGQGDAVVHISATALSTIKIPTPEKSEQTAIATVLSDTDALIEHLEKLIAKKKAIKQGAMQQLLTGKKRLPGFSVEWEVKKLREICWYQEGPGVRNYQFTASGVKLLNGTNISNGKVILDTTNRYISEKEAFGWYSHFLVDEGDILIASSGVTIDRFHEKVAFASSNDLPLCMNTSTIRFKVNLKFLDKYLYFFLQSILFKNQIRKQATGSAQLNFGPSHLNKIDIDFPPTIEEQTAITTVLLDMDSEIKSLEQKRDKYTMLKQGMMQQLLTGRIRIYASN